MEQRLSVLGATGVGVAGLATSGWWALLWGAQAAADGLSGLWLPLVAQVAVTGAIAAAVGWQLHRSVRPVRQSLSLLEAQAAALAQGRPVVVQDPPLPEAVPLAHSLNTLARRLQGIETPSGGSAPNDSMRRLARTDPETGFDSRFTFLRRLTERLTGRDAPETALVCVRVPALRAGFDDAARVVLCDALRELARSQPDAFVGRLGELEFALCLPRHGSAAAVMAALRPRAPGALAALDGLGGHSLAAVMGLLEQALADAQAGAGQAVRTGAAAVPAAEPQREAIVAALQSGRVRLAEFPVLDPFGQLLHLECPLRLQLDAKGVYEPADRWLPQAVRARLTTQIDLAAVELALAACAADGVGRCVHVAAESLATAEFVSAVRARLEAAPEAAHRLWIEIAEVSFERLPPRLRNAGTAWRRCGARVGIEHAGAALRSLVHLGGLDIDYVKVDPSFVRGLAADAEQREWARGLVGFVHEFGASVYAEGADADADLSALWDLGFDGATGRAVTRWHESTAASQAMSPA